MERWKPRCKPLRLRCSKAGCWACPPRRSGLAADSDNDAAVAQIFAAKGRPGQPSADRACGRRRRHHPLRQGSPGLCPATDRCVLARPTDPDPAAPAACGQGIDRRSGQRGSALPVPPRGPCGAAGLPAARSPVCRASRPPAPTSSAASAPPRPSMWPPSLARNCWCSMAVPAKWGLSPPSSTAHAACPCCCALAPSRVTI